MPRMHLRSPESPVEWSLCPVHRERPFSFGRRRPFSFSARRKRKWGPNRLHCKPVRMKETKERSKKRNARPRPRNPSISHDQMQENRGRIVCTENRYAGERHRNRVKTKPARPRPRGFCMLLCAAGLTAEDSTFPDRPACVPRWREHTYGSCRT